MLTIIVLIVGAMAAGSTLMSLGLCRSAALADRVAERLMLRLQSGGRA